MKIQILRKILVRNNANHWRNLLLLLKSQAESCLQSKSQNLLQQFSSWRSLKKERLKRRIRLQNWQKWWLACKKLEFVRQENAIIIRKNLVEFFWMMLIFSFLPVILQLDQMKFFMRMQLQQCLWSSWWNDEKESQNLDKNLD